MCLTNVSVTEEVIKRKLVTSQTLSYNCKNNYCFELSNDTSETKCELQSSKPVWDVDVRCNNEFLEKKSQ